MHLRDRSPRLALSPLALLLLPGLAAAQGGADDELRPAARSAPLEWRELGPSTFSGRIVDVAVRAEDPSAILAASGSGGLWRTENLGTTWECIFQDEAVISIGDVAWDESDPDVIWVGTGEANNQRSSYWGDGVYRTEDGGETWTNVGLRDSHHIGRIVLHPERPGTAYVAALGHLYTPNAERGLYKTEDGGATWRPVLRINEDVGVVDVVLDPFDPETVYAASYERRRRAWHFDGNGPGSGIWRSRDGGLSWTRLSGGLPEGDVGRIGLDVSRLTPGMVVAAVADQNRVEVAPEGDPTVALATEFEDGRLTVRRVRDGSGPAELGLERGDVLVALGEHALDSRWALLGALARLDPDTEVDLVLERGGDEVRLRVTAAALERAAPETPRTREVGGGVFVSLDGGDTWERRNDEPVGGDPAYYYGQVRVDPSDDDRLYVLSVPLYVSSDGGRTWSRDGGRGVHVDHHALWIDPADSRRVLLGNDGGLHLSHDRTATWHHFDNLPLAQFYAVGVDRQVPYRVYGGTQDNGTWGGPSRSRERRGVGTAEWERVGGGDGFYAQVDLEDPDTVYGESQFGFLYRRDVRRHTTRMIRPRAPEGEEYRFNWNSPVLVSRHNSRVVYFGGNRLFRSLDRGDHWTLVTRDLTTADPEKLEGNVPHCTLTAIDEGHEDPDLLLVGSDDGLLHLSRDGGHTWENLTGRLPGAPAHWWVSRVLLSDHDPERAYVTLTGYREDDFRPLVYRTDDLGETWRRLDGGLPEGSVNVIREDPWNEDVLYVGTEFGLHVSLDAGETWEELGRGLPTVPVHDLVIQPDARELVAATHGRGFWIVDVGALADLARGTEEPLRLVGSPDWQRLDGRGLFTGSGHAAWFGENPEDGVAIPFEVSAGLAEVGGKARLSVKDARGRVLREWEEEVRPGLNVARWRPGRRTGDVGERLTVRVELGDHAAQGTVRVLSDPEGE